MSVVTVVQMLIYWLSLAIELLVDSKSIHNFQQFEHNHLLFDAKFERPALNKLLHGDLLSDQNPRLGPFVWTKEMLNRGN